MERNIYSRLSDLLIGQEALSGPKSIEAGTKVSDEMLHILSKGLWWQIVISDDTITSKIEALNSQYEAQKMTMQERYADKVEKVRRGDDLPSGVMKMVKVFVAVKRKLQPGDKMAGRHGNKGVISKAR